MPPAPSWITHAQVQPGSASLPHQTGGNLCLSSHPQVVWDRIQEKSVKWINKCTTESQSHIHLSQQTPGQGVCIFFLSLSLEVAWVVINSACPGTGFLWFKFHFLYLLDACPWTVPQFLHLQNGDSNSIPLAILWWGLNEKIHFKCLEKCLVQSRPPVHIHPHLNIAVLR